MPPISKEDNSIIAYALGKYAERMYDDMVTYKRQGNEPAAEDCHKHYKRATELSDYIKSLSK